MNTSSSSQPATMSTGLLEVASTSTLPPPGGPSGDGEDGSPLPPFHDTDPGTGTNADTSGSDGGLWIGVSDVPPPPPPLPTNTTSTTTPPSMTSALVQRVPPSEASIQERTGIQRDKEAGDHSNPIFVFPTSDTTSSPPLFDVPQHDLTPTGPLSHEVTVDALTLKNHLSEQRGGSGGGGTGGGSNASNAGGPPSGSEALRAVLSESGSRGLQSAISSRKPLAHAANMPVLTNVDQSNEAVAQRMLMSEWCKLPPRRNLEGTPLEEDYSLASRVGIFLTSTSWMIFPLLLLNILLDVLIVGFFTGGTPKAQATASAQSYTNFEMEDSSYLFFVNTGLTLVGFFTYLPCAHFLHGYFSVPSLAIFTLTAYQVVLLVMFVYARYYGVYVDEKGYSLWGEVGPIGDDPVVIQLIFVPYFLRLWGTQAHIKIVTSVMAWRSGLDRLKILRDLFSVVAVFIATVFTSAGLFQIIEYTQGGVQYSMLDALYWTIVTFSTIGYGEMSPTSELGRLLVICLIFTALILVPVFINVIEYVATMWPRFNNYVSTGRNHVVVSANITFKELRMLLDEMCFVDPFTDMVFVSSRGFSAKCYALLRDVKYRTRLTLIEGSIRDRAVMERARLTTANAAFLMSAKYSVAMRGDYATLRDSVALRNFDRKLPQYLWLKYGTHDHLLDGVFCVTHGLRYLRTFLATASVLPGVIPFVVNLVRTQCQTRLLLGRERKGKVGKACAAIFGGFLQIESSSSEEESDEDDDNDKSPKNESPKIIKKARARRATRDPTESIKTTGSPSISRRNSQTSTSSTLHSTNTNDDDNIRNNNIASDEENLAGSRRKKVKRLHIPVELTADIATSESVLRRAFRKKYRDDWELLYGIGRFNALLLLDAPDAYVGRPYNVCILHAFLYSRAILVGLIRDGKLTVNPTVDHPFQDDTNNGNSSTDGGGGGVRNGTFVFNETTNSRGGTPSVVTVQQGDQFLAILPKSISLKFKGVVSEEIAECDNLLSMGGVFDMSLNQTLRREPSLWAADGGIGGGGILNPPSPHSPETPFARPSSSPLRTRAEELDVTLGQTITEAEAKLVKEEERWNRRKENKAHFLIMDVPTELRDPGYTLYERNLSERTRLWNLSLIMRSIMGVHANSKITLISPLPLSRKFYFEWNRQGFPKLDFVQGSSLNSHTVQNAISTDFNHFTRSHRTQGVIIFTSSQGARSLGDAPLYGAFTSVRKVLSNMGARPNYDTQVVMELSTFSASNLVGPFHDDLRLRRDSEEDFQMSIPFMTGKVFATDMLQPLLVQTYGNPYVSEFFASLFNLTSTRKRHMYVQKKGSEREDSKKNSGSPLCTLGGCNNNRGGGIMDADGDAALDLACMGGATADFDRNSRPNFDSSLNSTATTGNEPARRDGINPWTKRRLRRAQMSFEELSRSTKAPLVLPAVASAVNFRVYSNRRLHFKSFGEAFRHLLVSRGMLAFGIFREFPTNMEGNPRYMITNPPPYAYMMSTDHIYCYVPWKAPPPTGGSDNSSTDAEDGTNPTDSE